MSKEDSFPQFELKVMEQHLPKAGFDKWKELGPYRHYDAQLEDRLGKRQAFPIHEYKDNKGYTCFYLGEWVSRSFILWTSWSRQGRGTLITSGYSMCEGYFQKGKAIGKGRVIYDDGNVYEGDFKDLKKQPQEEAQPKQVA